MATVRVGKTAYAVEVGTNLGQFLVKIGAGEFTCGGHGRCGQCRVMAVGSLNCPTASERAHLSEEELQSGIRLACCAVVEGDVLVNINPVPTPVVCTDGERITARSPRFSRYGVAVDLGTTTIAARLYDWQGVPLAEIGCANPQAVWGADVISRIEAALGGASAAIAAETAQVLDRVFCSLAEQAEISATEIDGAVVTGNTAMLSLLVGASTETLARAPFAMPRTFGESMTASALGLSVLSPETPVFLPPCIAPFVGADTVTALLASPLKEGEVLVDIGTNGEMVLRVGDRLLCGSVAAGPAFEGAGISMGMPAADGAVDRVILQGQTLVPHVIGDGAPRGICGSGLVDAVACLVESFRMDATGRLRSDPMPIAPPVMLTQMDVRAVQMAKSAVCSGILTLLQVAGKSVADLQAVTVAGGFGHSLNAKNAARIGLIPRGTDSRVRTVGNGALTGAAMLLLDRKQEDVCAAVVASAEVVELSTEPFFAKLYVENLNI